MATLKVTRNHGWFGRMRAARIMADSIEIGRVRSGETVDVQVPDDAQCLFAKMDWGRSEPYPLSNVSDGQTIYMNAWFTLNPLRSMGLWPIPITLEDQPR